MATLQPSLPIDPDRHELELITGGMLKVGTARLREPLAGGPCPPFIGSCCRAQHERLSSKTHQSTAM